MSEQSVFHDLSSTLTESERSELLKKIRESLNMQEDREDNVFQKEISQEERVSLARHELQMVSPYRQLVIWIKSKFLGKKKTEVFIQYKLKQIKNAIRRKSPGLTGFETRDLSPQMAMALFQIYSHVVPVRKVFRNMWSRQEIFETVIITLLEEVIENPIRNLSNLISLEEMQEIYAKNNSLNTLKNEVLKRIQEYTSSIPRRVFSDLEKNILPLYNLKEIVLFPYHSFFDLFHFTPNINSPNQKPFFRSASALLCLDFLEKLYYSLYAVTKIDDATYLETDLVFTVNTMFNEKIEPETADPLLDDENDSDDNMDKENFATEIESIIRLCKQMYVKMPIAEILKYFKKDPYYKLVFYMPTLDLEAFYASVLKIRFLADVSEIYPEVRNLYIEKQIEQLFHNKNYVHFQFYRIYSSIDYDKIGLPFFNYTRSLSLLYNYIRIFYKQNMQEIVQILDRGVLAQNRISRDRLLQHAAALEDVEDRIKQFDTSLSSDNEDGKLFHRLRFTLATDIAHQKMYRTLVTQKDREVQDLLERGEAGLLGLKKLFEELVVSNAETVRIQVRSHYMISGKSANLEKTLRIWSHHIEMFLNLYAQVLRVEKG